ncbi:energy-coupling factor ABC transporter ATP-binding protein [Cetobacterium sp. SF1]|uniref:energy-coupling factor ABC transporter ATP-binding protein n=1 Tax=Cetobacterium sp. SF1 TaxID=3417654 RepID=UPI003CFAAE9B
MEILLKNINMVYGNSKKIIFENLNLKIKDCSWNFIVGKSGSGKSTLLQIISGLIKINSGDIFYGENNLKTKEGLKYLREKVRILFQYTEKQFFNETVKKELIYSLKRKKLSQEIIDKKLKKILTLLEFSENILEKSPWELSGGEKRMVALGSILIDEPEIILLDEPTVGLDVYAKRRFYKVLEELKKNSVTIIEISHNLEDTITYGDNLFFLNDGKLLAEGNPMDILSDEENLNKGDLIEPEILKIFRYYKKYFPVENLKTVEGLMEKIYEKKNNF